MAHKLSDFMKNLPCLVFLSAAAGLLVLALASAFGAPFSLLLVASYWTGISATAGVLTMAFRDYAPRHSTPLHSSEPVSDAKVEAAENAWLARFKHSGNRRDESDPDLTTFGLRRGSTTLL
jgi:hypothetical protein